MGQQGFTLIEQIVTVAIMAMVLVAGIAALSTGALGLTVTVSRNQAMNLAQERIECIKALPYDPQTYSAVCAAVAPPPPAGYQVTTDVVVLGDTGFPTQFTDNKVRLIKVNVLRGSTSILEIEDLKVDRPVEQP